MDTNIKKQFVARKKLESIYKAEGAQPSIRSTRAFDKLQLEVWREETKNMNEQHDEACDELRKAE